MKQYLLAPTRAQMPQVGLSQGSSPSHNFDPGGNTYKATVAIFTRNAVALCRRGHEEGLSCAL